MLLYMDVFFHDSWNSNLNNFQKSHMVIYSISATWNPTGTTTDAADLGCMVRIILGFTYLFGAFM